MRKRYLALLLLTAVFVSFVSCTAPPVYEETCPPESTAEAASSETVMETAETMDISADIAANETLSAALDAALSGLESTWCVYFEDLSTGLSVKAEHGTTCGESMISASIIKLFIAGALYEKVENGEIDEEEIASDLYEMIRISDNNAANSLIELLGDGNTQDGMDAVNMFARSIGCEHSTLNREMLEDNGLQNYVSIDDCVRVLRMIYRGEFVSREASEKMLRNMLDGYWRDYIPSGFPEGTKIALKGGDLPELCHGDVGIVFWEDNAYIVCILCNYPEIDESCYEKITEISTLIYERVSCHGQSDS